MDSDKFMVKCDLCGMSFQFGPHKYDGKYLSDYKMSVCQGCLNAHWDVVGSSHEKQFKDHLKANNIQTPERNAKGWYPLK